MCIKTQAVIHSSDPTYDANEIPTMQGLGYDLTRNLVELRLSATYTTEERDTVVDEIIERSSRPVGRERIFFIKNLADNMATEQGKTRVD